jgi:hypothetical protein
MTELCLKVSGSNKLNKVSIMRKLGVFKWIILLQGLVLLLVGCGREEIVVVENPILSVVIGEAGGVVEGFNGEVVLAVPAGALTERVQFFMYELNNKSAQKESELIKAFVIEPFITFNVPAKLTVYTDGCLSNGNTICDDMDVALSIYESIQDYCSKSGEYCPTCCFEATSHTISACLERTGVISTKGEMRAKHE